MGIPQWEFSLDLGLVRAGPSDYALFKSLKKEEREVFLFAKNFQDKDPTEAREIMIVGKNFSLNDLKKKVENILSLKQKTSSITLLDGEIFNDLNSTAKLKELLKKTDLCLVFSQAKEFLHSEILFSFGVPVLSLEKTFQNKSSSAEHNYPSEEALLERLKNLLLDEQGQLTQLANLSRNLFVKEKNLNLKKKDLSFFHIFNPVPPSISNDLYIASPLVFKSLKQAKEFAGKISVNQALTFYEEEEDFAPKDFLRTSFLEKSVLDYRKFYKKRKLPLLRDIIQKAYEHSKEGDYIIYTNADIILLPHFYTRLTELVHEGYDGIVVNRRTLSKKWALEEEINGIYSELGESHPGFDCFVFKREAYPQFFLGRACLGAHLAGRSLFYNLLASSKKFIVLKEEHLTCHIGDDNASKKKEQLDYIEHNTNECIHVLEELEKRLGLYSRIKEQDLEKVHGENILKFNFAPGKFLERSFQENKILQKNALEKPLMIHSRDHNSASFLLEKISESKNRLKAKAKIKKNFLPFQDLFKSHIKNLEKSLHSMKTGELKDFYQSNLEIKGKIKSLEKNLSDFIENYENNQFSVTSSKQLYTFDCSQTDLKNPKVFRSFSSKIKELTQKEGVKTIVHLIYEKDYLPNLKEAFPQYHHITFFESKASDLVIQEDKLKKDPFYQMRVAFKLLCLNKTLEF